MAPGVVVDHKVRHRLFQFPGKEKGSELNNRFHRPVITLNLALRLGAKRTTVNVVDGIGFQGVASCASDESLHYFSLP